MWKSLGTTMLGLAVGFGAALLNAFQMPIVYLQAGMEWVVAHLLKGLLKIPGMADLLGFDENAVETNFGKILKDRKETGADLFGFTSKDMADSAANMMGSGAPALGDRVAEAARKAGEFGTNDLIDTIYLRDNMGQVIRSIRDSMPKPEAVKQAAKVVSQTAATGPVVSPQATRLDPIVTALGKVGGGGYSSGTLDAQRENNRLTGETNRLLKDMNRTIGNLGGSGQAGFG